MTGLKTIWDGVFRTRPCAVPFLAQVHLTSGLGTLNKHKNKTRQCACWAGGQRQWANIGIVFHLLPWWPKQGGNWQKEKEIKLGRQRVLGECLNVCMRSRWWGWNRESQETRRDGEGHVNTPLCCVSSKLSYHSTPAQRRFPKAQVRSTQPQNKQRWDTGSWVLLGGRQNQRSLSKVSWDEILSVIHTPDDE